MRNINKYTITVRREAFVKAIRNQQLSQIKAEKRKKIIDENNILSTLWQFKTSLENIDLFHEENSIMKVREFLFSFLILLKKIRIHKSFVNR